LEFFVKNLIIFRQNKKFVTHKNTLNISDVCLLDVDVLWAQGGRHSVALLRRCGTPDEVIQNNCTGNYDVFPLPMQLYKMCNAMCDTGDNCNGFDTSFK